MRIYLAIASGAACVTGACFLVAAAALWLSMHYSPLTADVIMGMVLILAGGVVAAALIAGRASALERSSIPEQAFENLGATELRGLGLMFESRPVLAAALALVLGLEKGMRKSGQRSS